MEVLNVAGLILGIISSAISIYVFFIDRPRRKAQQAGQSQQAPRQDAPGQQRQAPPPPPNGPNAKGEPASRGFSLSKLGAVFWGLLGFLCLSEGATFGEPFLLLLGGVFGWLAYKMWK